MEALSSKDSYALFKTLDDPVSEEGKWAVNALRTIKTFGPDVEHDDLYNGVIDSLSAVTLYTVARAETGGEVEPRQYGFHHSIATEVRERTVRLSEINQVQEKLREHDDKLELAEDYLGKIDRRGKSLEGRVRQIEDELENHRLRQYELFQNVIDNSGHLDIIYDDLAGIGQEVVDNSKHVDIIYDDIVDLSQDIETISDRISGLDETDSELKQADRDIDDRLNSVKELITGLEDQIESLEAEEAEIPGESGTPKILEIGLKQYVGDLDSELNSLEEETQQNKQSIHQLQSSMREIQNNLKELKEEDDKSSGLLNRIENWVSRGKSTEGEQTEIDDWV